MRSQRLIRSALAAISAPSLTVGILVSLSLLVVYGTLFQAAHGLFEAHCRIFDAWIVPLAGCIPFPGVRSVIALLCVNLLAAGYVRLRLSWRSVGLFCIHLGIVVMLIAGIASSMVRSDSVLTLGRGESADRSVGEDGREVALPFRCTLLDFSIKCHPGTATPADYVSRLRIVGPGIDHEVVVGMNRPFRYRDYTLYQSSFREDDAGVATGLAVVKNPLRQLPPFAAIMIAVGLMLHFVVKAAGRWRNHGD